MEYFINVVAIIAKGFDPGCPDCFQTFMDNLYRI